MKKILVSTLVLAIFGWLSVGVVSANEGTVTMKGNGVSGACFATSVYHDRYYKVLATCRDLKTALTPEKNVYVMWATMEDGTNRRLGEVSGGKLYAGVDRKFTGLTLTIESEPSPWKSSEEVILAGSLKPIDFGAGVSVETAAVTPTPTAVVTAKVQTQTVNQNTSSSNLGSVLGTVFKVVLLAFGILLVVVGVFSFLSKRRSL